MTQQLIRGLTLRHPWAWAFLHGKDVENRTWRPERQGGQIGMYLALHGGAPVKGAAYRDEVEDALHWMVGQGVLSDSSARLLCPDAAGPLPVLWPTGIVAVARLVGVVQDSPSPWAAQGQYHWQTADVLTLPEPIPHRGAQGLWTVESGPLEQLRAAWKGRAA